MSNVVKRILLVSSNTNFECGGVQNYLWNVLRHFDRSGYAFDLYITGKVSDLALLAKLESLEIKPIVQGMVPPKGKEPVAFKLRYYGRAAAGLRKLCQAQEYAAVHINSGALFYNAILLWAARCCGVRNRISHSHSAQRKTGLLRALLREMVARNATHRLACSAAAARALFPERVARNAIIVRNGIDTKKFAYDEETRKEYRKKLGYTKEDFVIGHVGRFEEVKNHAFLLDVFAEITRQCPHARLLLLGDGPLTGSIKEKTKAFGLEQQVIFAGVQDEPEKYYCAMDVFVLPSLYEGLGIVNIEAQASGLPCVVSEGVPREADVTHTMEFLPLQDVQEWARHIAAHEHNRKERSRCWETVRKAGYDLRDTACQLKEVYDSL